MTEVLWLIIFPIMMGHCVFMILQSCFAEARKGTLDAALIFAAQAGCTDSAKFLLDAGADVKASRISKIVSSRENTCVSRLKQGPTLFVLVQIDMVRHSSFKKYAVCWWEEGRCLQRG